VVPVALVTVICAAISFRLMSSGLWRIGPVIALIGTVVPRRALARSVLDISLAIGCLKEASSQAMT
jgi:hypothetical protein